ncbi:unnamed protein product [Schistosoma turkestanicum]|nr:unnamed protein product [Schistosoma turkestanicum]
MLCVNWLMILKKWTEDLPLKHIKADEHGENSTFHMSTSRISSKTSNPKKDVELRALHRCPKLKYDSKLASDSQKWAEHLAATNCLQHSRADDYGENLAVHLSSAKASMNGREATRIWYDEISKYDFNRQHQPSYRFFFPVRIYACVYPKELIYRYLSHRKLISNVPIPLYNISNCYITIMQRDSFFFSSFIYKNLRIILVN